MNATTFEQEARALLSFWQSHVITPQGYVPGSLNGRGEWNRHSPLGLVLHARILWTFSRAAWVLEDPTYAQTAHQVYRFIDQKFSLKMGYAWSLTPELQPLETKQQVYGLAFLLYALAAYQSIQGDAEVLAKACQLFDWIEDNGHDPIHQGYWEVFPAHEMVDIRLSDKDLDAPKSMNTHLHVLEGYAALYAIWPDKRLESSIRELISLFQEKIWQSKSQHLGLFFAADWSLLSQKISFGHEIEAAWLIPACAKVLDVTGEVMDFKLWTRQLTQAALEGWDTHSFWHEYDPQTGQYDKHREWWVSAEALIGFWDMYQLSQDSVYLDFTNTVWEFIQHHLKDTLAGEWFWGIDEAGEPMIQEDKAGFWKCPYHSVRACLEMRERLSGL